MRIINVFYLQEFAKRHADALAPLSQWAQETDAAGKYDPAGEGTFKAYYLAKPGLRMIVR